MLLITSYNKKIRLSQEKMRTGEESKKKKRRVEDTNRKRETIEFI